MISESARADVAKRIASPMQGGLGSRTALTLFPSPAPYVLRRMLRVRRAVQAGMVGAEGPS